MPHLPYAHSHRGRACIGIRESECNAILYRLCCADWDGMGAEADKFENIALTYGIDTDSHHSFYSSHCLFRFHNNFIYHEFAAVVEFLRNEVVNFYRFSLINTSQNTRKKPSPSARCENYDE